MSADRSPGGWVRRASMALLLVMASGSVVAADTVRTLADQVGDAAWWGDYRELQSLYDAARRSTERSIDGERPIEAFRRGFARIFNGNKNNDAFYTQMDALTGQWAAEHPEASMAHVLHARALYAHAWFLRGGGFASTVTPQAWSEFKRYLKMAEDHLARHSSVVMADSSTHLYLVMIGRSASRSFEAQWAIAQESYRVDPEDDAILAEMVISASPKWGGNAEQIERLARDAVRRTQAKRGLELYASVYLTAAYEYKAALFKATRADWPTMKQGFRDMLSRYPGPINVNRFAFVACLAQDKATTAELLDQIGDKPILRQWGDDGAYESCRRWARAS